MLNENHRVSPKWADYVLPVPCVFNGGKQITYKENSPFQTLKTHKLATDYTKFESLLA